MHMEVLLLCGAPPMRDEGVPDHDEWRLSVSIHLVNRYHWPIFSKRVGVAVDILETQILSELRRAEHERRIAIAKRVSPTDG